MKSNWTIKTLKKYVEAILAEKDKAISAALSSAEKAVIKAEEKQNQYNQGHNDLLKKMEDMIPRKEADAREKNYVEKLETQRKEIANITTRLDIIAGRGVGIQQIIGWIIAAIAIIGFFFTWFIKK